MKHTILFRSAAFCFFIALFLCSMESFSQGKHEELTVKEVFDLVETNSDYIVFFQNDQIDLTQRVQVASRNEPVDSLLAHALAGTNMGFRKVDDHIVIVPKQKNKQQEVQPQFTVTGTVSDDQGVTLPGVNVLI